MPALGPPGCNGPYKGFMSREPVHNAGDEYPVGLSITRVRDFRDVFKFSANTPEEISLEYANRIATELKHGAVAVVSMPGPAKGMKSYSYNIVVETKEGCVTMILVVAMKEKVQSLLKSSSAPRQRTVG